MDHNRAICCTAGFAYDPATLKETGTFKTPLTDGRAGSSTPHSVAPARRAGNAGTPLSSASTSCALRPIGSPLRTSLSPQLGHHCGDRQGVCGHRWLAQGVFHRRTIPAQGTPPTLAIDALLSRTCEAASRGWRSDGCLARVWYANVTQRTVEVHDNGMSVPFLNELEFIDGEARAPICSPSPHACSHPLCTTGAASCCSVERRSPSLRRCGRTCG